MIAAQRYAQAILNLAEEKQSTRAIYNNAIELSKIILSNRTFYNFIKSPLIQADKKDKIFRQLFEKQIHPILTQFISILCKRRREALLPDILKAIVTEYKKRNHIITTQLITTFKLDEELKKLIIQKIQQIKPSSQIELEEIIDERIIGGFILKTENEQIDASIKTQLNQLYQQFIQTNSLN